MIGGMKRAERDRVTRSVSPEGRGRAEARINVLVHASSHEGTGTSLPPRRSAGFSRLGNPSDPSRMPDGRCRLKPALRFLVPHSLETPPHSVMACVNGFLLSPV